MKQAIKSIGTGLFALIAYLFLNFFSNFILLIIGIDVNHLTLMQKIMCSFFIDLFLILLLISIYHRRLIDDLMNLKACHFSKYIRYWFIALGLMAISNILINMIINIDTPSNQEAIIKLFSKVPIYACITTIIFAPILEELVFRLSFRKMFKNDLLFIIISGLFFGSMHVLSSTSYSELLYVIPYSIPGFIFAYTLIKSDNIFVPIGLHFIHNSSMMLLQIILSLL